LSYQETVNPNETALYQSMSLTSYKGTWNNKNANSASLFKDFTNREGNILLDFNGGIEKRNRVVWYDQTEAEDKLSQVNLVMIDGIYYDEVMYFITLEDSPEETFTISSNVLSIKSTNKKIGKQEGCNLDLQIDFNDLVPKNIDNSGQENPNINESGVILIKMISSNCAVNF